MNRQAVIDSAIRTSLERGCVMYVIYDDCEGDYGFTQERDIFLTYNQRIVYLVDGHSVETFYN